MFLLRQFLKIRISTIAVILFVIFQAVVFTIHRQELTDGQLALFSVNSFLFGYYFGPLLDSQKSRVASLISTIRQEEMVILDILTQSHLLSAADRHILKVKLRVYLESIIKHTDVSADNKYYDELLYFTKKIKGKDAAVMDVIYGRVSKTQENRDAMNNLFTSRIYSHEWIVAIVLFSITMYFAMQTNFGNSYFFGIMLAILLTGLSLLMVILAKFATLTHKEAKRMWVPLENILEVHFDDVTAQEVRAEKAQIDKQPA